MSKHVKGLITASYKRRFTDHDGAVLVEIRGIKSNDLNKLRGELAKQKMRAMVVKNSLAKKAVEGTRLAGLDKMIEGPTTFVYGGDSVVNIARELVKLVKEIENLKLKGALMEGEVYGPDQIENLSKFPTRAEAHGQVVQLFLSPARKLSGQLVGPGRKVAGLVEAIKGKLEKGEAITAVGAGA
jgi:large subunit ribosomal protein L10